MRATLYVCLFLAAAGLASCGRKPEAPARQAADSAADSEDTAETEDEVGVGDVVDYAIGKTQLDAKKRIESDLKGIQEDRNRRIQEALGE